VTDIWKGIFAPPTQQKIHTGNLADHVIIKSWTVDGDTVTVQVAFEAWSTTYEYYFELKDKSKLNYEYVKEQVLKQIRNK
jgi:hypothetical protein